MTGRVTTCHLNAADRAGDNGLPCIVPVWRDLTRSPDCAAVLLPWFVKTEAVYLRGAAVTWGRPGHCRITGMGVTGSGNLSLSSNIFTSTLSPLCSALLTSSGPPLLGREFLEAIMMIFSIFSARFHRTRAVNLKWLPSAAMFPTASAVLGGCCSALHSAATPSLVLQEVSGHSFL